MPEMRREAPDDGRYHHAAVKVGDHTATGAMIPRARRNGASTGFDHSVAATRLNVCDPTGRPLVVIDTTALTKEGIAAASQRTDEPLDVFRALAVPGDAPVAQNNRQTPYQVDAPVGFPPPAGFNGYPPPPPPAYPPGYTAPGYAAPPPPPDVMGMMQAMMAEIAALKAGAAQPVVRPLAVPAAPPKGEPQPPKYEVIFHIPRSAEPNAPSDRQRGWFHDVVEAGLDQLNALVLVYDTAYRGGGSQCELAPRGEDIEVRVDVPAFQKSYFVRVLDFSFNRKGEDFQTLIVTRDPEEWPQGPPAKGAE